MNRSGCPGRSTAIESIQAAPGSPRPTSVLGRVCSSFSLWGTNTGGIIRASRKTERGSCHKRQFSRSMVTEWKEEGAQEGIRTAWQFGTRPEVAFFFSLEFEIYLRLEKPSSPKSGCFPSISMYRMYVFQAIKIAKENSTGEQHVTVG